jgi:hypothetical protein
MDEEFPVIPLVILAALGLYMGYEINRRRNNLRRVFNTFDKRESKIAHALEGLVESGQLKPYVPEHAT